MINTDLINGARMRAIQTDFQALVLSLFELLRQGDYNEARYREAFELALFVEANARRVEGRGFE